jgi:hypothetical protein
VNLGHTSDRFRFEYANQFFQRSNMVCVQTKFTPFLLESGHRMMASETSRKVQA